MDIISYQDIKKEYDGQVAIEHINLSIKIGTFVTIIGSSGCGKTTLLKIVNGLVEPTSGEIFIDGQNIKEKNIIDHRRNIGYSIQGSILFPHMTVAQNIAYVPSLKRKHDKKGMEQLVEHWLNMIGLDSSYKDRYPDELSGGQQQRVGIARALSASPKILLMDEPFGFVDEITRTQLQQELKQLHKKTEVTILFVTHDISEALMLGDKIIVMDKGTIHQYGTPKQIIQSPSTSFVKKLVDKLTCPNVAD